MADTEMTGRERLLSAIRHEPPDRVPVSPRIWAWLLDHYGDASLQTYLRSCDEFGYDAFWCQGGPDPNYIFSWPDDYDLPDVQVDQTRGRDGEYEQVRRTFHTPAGTLSDAVRIPPAGDVWGISPNPSITEHLVKTAEDLDRLRYLLPPLIRGHDAYHRAVEAVGDRGLVELYVYGPLDCRAGDARGMQQLMIDYYEDRPLFDALIELCHQRMMAETRAALEDGVQIIFGSWFYESLSAGWSPGIWQEVFLPRLTEHVALVHSAEALYHLYDDGKLAGILDWLTEAGVDVVSTCTPPPIGDFDLAEAKQRLGDRLCFKGCVDLLYVVKEGTPELITQTVRDAMAIGSPGGGFILGSSDSFRDGTPIENVRAYFDAARRYG